MAGLVPAIHVFNSRSQRGRAIPGSSDEFSELSTHEASA
jgi:hypothetical protein